MITEKQKPIINFRVYRRTQENIILLFNKRNLLPDQVKEINLKVVELGSEKEIKFKADTSIMDENIKAKDDTIMLLVNHIENEFDPYAKYRIKLTLGTTNQFFQEIVVFPFSVLPNRTKDNKENYTFLFAWNEKEQCFCKLNGEYDKQGRFCLLTKASKE